jgi:hypothetical protein
MRRPAAVESISPAIDSIRRPGLVRRSLDLAGPFLRQESPANDGEL